MQAPVVGRPAWVLAFDSLTAGVYVVCGPFECVRSLTINVRGDLRAELMLAG